MERAFVGRSAICIHSAQLISAADAEVGAELYGSNVILRSMHALFKAHLRV